MQYFLVKHWKCNPPASMWRPSLWVFALMFYRNVVMQPITGKIKPILLLRSHRLNSVKIIQWCTDGFRNALQNVQTHVHPLLYLFEHHTRNILTRMPHDFDFRWNCLTRMYFRAKIIQKYNILSNETWKKKKKIDGSCQWDLLTV